MGGKEAAQVVFIAMHIAGQLGARDGLLEGAPHVAQSSLQSAGQFGAFAGGLAISLLLIPGNRNAGFSDYARH